MNQDYRRCQWGREAVITECNTVPSCKVLLCHIPNPALKNAPRFRSGNIRQREIARTLGRSPSTIRRERLLPRVNLHIRTLECGGLQATLRDQSQRGQPTDPGHQLSLHSGGHSVLWYTCTSRLKSRPHTLQFYLGIADIGYISSLWPSVRSTLRKYNVQAF